MRVLLISTYELGRQPFGLASPAAWLRQAGWAVDCLDATRDRLTDPRAAGADLVGVHLPMHTATRLAGPLVERVRAMNPTARICAYGLYAPLNEEWLRSLGVDDVLGAEFEADLTRIANEMGGEPVSGRPVHSRSHGLERLNFLVPDRSQLPPLSQYAALHMPDGTRKLVGSTEASRGCKHLCRHCPIVPVYDGRFRVVQAAVVVADIDAQVAAGAGHITFGDPDFFNGPSHSMQIVEALHAAHPHVTFDVTIKIEHLLTHRHLLSRLAELGCAFVTSAVESIDDEVLALLEKGHTRADFVSAVQACRSAGLTLMPTFVAFHPWLTLTDYCDLLDTLAHLDLVENVAPIQLAIRLLVTSGSRLLDVPELADYLQPFDPATLSYPWIHPDPAVDALQRDVIAMVASRPASDRRTVFEEIRVLAWKRAGMLPGPRLGDSTKRVPFLDEPWYCCAEPNPDDLRII
jgi:radical SAM superfamily enzyme YgiQ (UPF0313 family)